MQEEDWGKFSQAPWMTEGASKDTNTSNHSKKIKAKQPAQISTTEHAYNFSEETSSQDEDKFRNEVDLADLKIKLRRWNFARSWGSSLADELHISPRSRPKESWAVGKPATCPSEADQVERSRTEHDDLAGRSCHQVNAIAKPNPPLDRNLIGQYLDKCIAATESQLAGRRNKSKKKGAVKEIERLVEKVVTQAGLACEKVDVSVASGDVVSTAVGAGRREEVRDEVAGGKKGRRC